MINKIFGTALVLAITSGVAMAQDPKPNETGPAVERQVVMVPKAENERTPVEFYKGHHHDHNGTTQGAPQHSGGTDVWGCHNGSVLYHCH